MWVVVVTKMANKRVFLVSAQRHSGSEDTHRATPHDTATGLQAGTIDTMPIDRVCFLFNQDKSRTDKLVMAHTGIYDGRGNVIQAGGQYKGVSDKPINHKRWSHWATLKGVGDETMAEDRVLKYTTVYARRGCSPCAGTAHRLGA